LNHKREKKRKMRRFPLHAERMKDFAPNFLNHKQNQPKELQEQSPPMTLKNSKKILKKKRQKLHLLVKRNKD